MSDLISKSALIEKMNDTGVQISFDLPVEEILGEDVDIDDLSILVQDAIQAYRKMVIDTIQEQPTAYDVEKMVEQIGNISEPIRPVGWSRKIEVVETKAVIDIVRAGGKE